MYAIRSYYERLRVALVVALDVELAVVREVDDALISVQKSREQLEAEGRRVQALTDDAHLAPLRYDAG